MERSTVTNIQKSLHKIKLVVKFALLLLLKALAQPKTSHRTHLVKDSQNAKVGHSRQLLLLLYRLVKNSLQKTVKSGKPLQVRKKRTFKTRARIQQDFKEWYNALKEEFKAYADPVDIDKSTKRVDQGLLQHDHSAHSTDINM
ncbi:MAG: hypothetical protein AAGB24_13935 [Bacteroidota bacterium]